MLHVGVEHHVLNRFNLVVRVVDHFKVCGWSEIQHLLDPIIARIELDQVLHISQLLQSGQRVPRDVNILQVLVTSNPLITNNSKKRRVREEVAFDFYLP